MVRRTRPAIILLLAVTALLATAGSAFAQGLPTPTPTPTPQPTATPDGTSSPTPQPMPTPIPGGLLRPPPADVTVQAPFRTFVSSFHDPTARIKEDITLRNYTNETKRVRLEIEGAPEGWDVAFYDFFFELQISEVAVEAESYQTIGLWMILPNNEAPPGTYTMTLTFRDAANPDTVYDSFPVSLVALPKYTPPDNGLDVQNEYPTLIQPPGQPFTWSLKLTNNTGADATFNLRADLPEFWQASFKPASGNNVINTVGIRNTESQTITLTVRPNQLAEAGRYPIAVTATNAAKPTGRTVVNLVARITGVGQIKVTTPTGLLNVSARAGGAARSTVRVMNTGAAPLSAINLQSDSPSNWTVEFDSRVVEGLAPGAHVDVPFTVTPPGDAIPADYPVTLRANHPRAAGAVTVRVAVEQATVWKWLGLVLVGLVGVGLGGIYVRLARK